MRQNFPHCLQFYLQLILAYSCHYIKERKAKRIFLLRMKQRLSNLLVVKIYSMVLIRICLLRCAATEQLPNKSVSIKTVSVTSSNVQSMVL